MTNREKVIRAVDSCFDYWLDQHRCLNPLELEHVRQYKTEALALLKEQEQTPGGWVSVKDRLPEENQEYIVFVTDVEGEKCVTVDQWLSHARHWFLFDDKAESKVTHWMPMPPRPKEDT